MDISRQQCCWGESLLSKRQKKPQISSCSICSEEEVLGNGLSLLLKDKLNVKKRRITGLALSGAPTTTLHERFAPRHLQVSLTETCIGRPEG